MDLKVRAVLHSSANANSPSPQSALPVGFKSPLKNPRPIAGGFVKVQAHAKINLHLDVLDKLPNGYHNIVSVMQSVALHDDLFITAGGNESSNPKISITCDNPRLPRGENNLVHKAAKLLINEYGINQHINIKLNKRIPVGAGLAGGSADCAAALRGINRLFGLGIPMRRLMELGASLGADVPFCLVGGTALAEGIGERIKSLPPHPHCYIVIVCPGKHVSTPDTYRRLDMLKSSEPGQYKRDAAQIINAVSAKNLPEIAKNFYNVFTPVTVETHPVIFEILSEFVNTATLGASMSGTGSAVYAYFDNEKNAKEACDKFKDKFQVFLTTPS